MYLLMRTKMIQVSAPIHGGSPVFKHDSIGLSTSVIGHKKGGGGGYQKGGGGGNYQNGNYQKNLLIQKELYRCNGFPVLDDHIATKTIYSSNHHYSSSTTPYKKSQSNGAGGGGASYRTPNAQKAAQQQQHRYSPNPKSVNYNSTQRAQMPSSNNNNSKDASKLTFGDKEAAAASQQTASGNFSSTEPILFAGSKSCSTPSPMELPKPPQNWTTSRSKQQQQQQQQSSAAVVAAKSVASASVDLTHHDSAVLLSIK